MRHMHTYLVGTACLKAAFNLRDQGRTYSRVRALAIALYQFVISDGMAAMIGGFNIAKGAADNGHFFPVIGRARNTAGHAAFARVRRAARKTDIAAVDGMLGELFGQALMGFVRLGDD